VELFRLLSENYKLATAQKPHNRWLKRLVDTRSIWIMPNANALGYHQNVRAENGVDPNRDFPYGRTPRTCMQTTAVRGALRFPNTPHYCNVPTLAVVCASALFEFVTDWLCASVSVSASSASVSASASASASAGAIVSLSLGVIVSVSICSTCLSGKAIETRPPPSTT
jgi:hypothetical protein